MAIHKYKEILETIQEDISSGRYRPGQRLPSEAELVRRYRASRMTVFRAMHDLQSMGIVTRRVGSGTFVSPHSHAGSLVFGLIIPELGQTEIFEVICKGMMEAPQAAQHSLLWGNTAAGENHKGKANIPVILLDRCIERYPRRSHYDLIGIDNRRTAFLAVEHLINGGAKRIAFFARPDSAPTVDARIAGYREALQSLTNARGLIVLGDATDQKFVKRILSKARPDAFLCANDRTAGNLMHTLLSIGKRIPEDIRMVGIDDVKYACLLPVPLTTQHQPCRDIGRMALAAMLDRISNPGLPPRDVLLGCELIVRQSCGANNAKVAAT